MASNLNEVYTTLGLAYPFAFTDGTNFDGEPVGCYFDDQITRDTTLGIAINTIANELRPLQTFHLHKDEEGDVFISISEATPWNGDS